MNRKINKGRYSRIKKSFQELPLLLGSHRIPFQVPAIVSEKVNIPPDLVVLFHNANVLVKALTPLFTQISTVFWDIYMWPQKMQFDWHSCSELAQTLQYLFSFLPVFRTPVVSQELLTSVTVRQTIQLFSVLEFPYLRAVKYTNFEFLHFYPYNFSWRKANPLSSQSFAFTKFFITLYLICKGGSSILFISTWGWDWTLCEPGYKPCLNDHSCLI